MNDSDVSLEDILAGLRAGNLLPDESADRANTLIENLRAVQPWYIRTMVGFGAWLASLLLIGFVAGFSLAMNGGYMIVGFGMVAAAVALRRRFDTDFMVQSTLAVSLAGQGLFAFGIAKFSSDGNFETVLTAIAITNVALFIIFPDRIHRVLSVLFVTTALTILIYIHELNSVVPVLGPAFAAALVFLHKRLPTLAAGGMGPLVRPLMTGMMLSAFGFLLLSTIYILPELAIEYSFYPRPWVSTALLGALFVYLGTDIWPQILDSNQKAAAPVVYGLMAVVIAAAWAAPGLLLALIVVMLGSASGNRVFVGAGIAFLAVFLSTYFYGIQITMLTKSITLVATGTAILIARWLILKVVKQVAGGPANA